VTVGAVLEDEDQGQYAEYDGDDDLRAHRPLAAYGLGHGTLLNLVVDSATRRLYGAGMSAA